MFYPGVLFSSAAGRNATTGSTAQCSLIRGMNNIMRTGWIIMMIPRVDSPSSPRTTLSTERLPFSRIRFSDVISSLPLGHIFYLLSFITCCHLFSDMRVPIIRVEYFELRIEMLRNSQSSAGRNGPSATFVSRLMILATGRYRGGRCIPIKILGDCFIQMIMNLSYCQHGVL